MSRYFAILMKTPGSPACHLIPLGHADPVVAAPLADAGLTPYHAIKLILPHLARGGASVLVIGLGGLGQIGVQILRALTGATIYATDMKPEAVALAQTRGAIGIPEGADQAEFIRNATDGRGVDAVVDFVGASPTITLAKSVIAQGGRIQIVGIAGGTVEWSFFATPYESVMTNTYWGSIADLHEVVAMYRAGQITPDVQTYTMDEALTAYELLRDGKLSARAVVTPNA